MKYSEVLKSAVDKLNACGHDEAALDAWYLMEEVSGFNRTKWFMNSMATMPETEKVRFEEYVERLLKDEPVSYILENREFMGLSFHVDENVLIPRQDTELLVEEAIEAAKKVLSGNAGSVTETSEFRILDLCTGSGCIAVSVKKFLETYGDKVSVDASDISEKALAVAEKNAADNNISVTFIKSNMFEEICGKYDMIISNPPYIPKVQMEGLDRKVAEYEPHGALYGGEDGLDFYRIIANESVKYLKSGGGLLLEIGFDQGETVPELLKEAGFKEIEVLKDYNNLNRVVKAVWV